MPRPADRDRRIAARVEGWFALNARALPWRNRPPGRRDPYHALVCETMAQQTQIARVAERFVTFIERFPTVTALARADADEVRALWSGLGYYRRAANLHAAAKAVMEQFDGMMPQTAAELRTLPGVGAYTAGAVASMAAGERVPAVDGNVARVLMRLEARRGVASDPAERRWAHERALPLVQAAHSPGSLNEGLMELGATICTPRTPDCGECPLSRLCRARRAGEQDEIPAPAKAAMRTDLYCDSVLIEDGRGRLLVERRPERGMWAGLWQAPTVEGPEASHVEHVAEVAGVAAGALERIEAFTNITTHRTVRFVVWRARQGKTRAAEGRRTQAHPSMGERAWRTREEIAQLGLSGPQRRILLGG